MTSPCEDSAAQLRTTKPPLGLAGGGGGGTAPTGAASPPRESGLRPALPSRDASGGRWGGGGGGTGGGAGGRLLQQRAQGCRKPLSRGVGGARPSRSPPQGFGVIGDPGRGTPRPNTPRVRGAQSPARPAPTHLAPALRTWLFLSTVASILRGRGGEHPRAPPHTAPSAPRGPPPGPSQPLHPQTRDLPPPRGSHGSSCWEGASERGNREGGGRVTSAPSPSPPPGRKGQRGAEPSARPGTPQGPRQHPPACVAPQAPGPAATLARASGCVRWPGTRPRHGQSRVASAVPAEHPGVPEAVPAGPQAPTESSRHASRRSAPAGTAHHRCPAHSSHTPAGRSLDGRGGDTSGGTGLSPPSPPQQHPGTAPGLSPSAQGDEFQLPGPYPSTL